MKEATVPPHWARVALVEAFELFETYELECLGEALGYSHHAHAQAKRTRLTMAAVSHEVNKLHTAGMPLNANRESEGAFEVVARRRGMSAAQVKKLKGEWEDLCRRTGSAPYTAPATLQSRELIFSVLADALRGVKRNKDQEE